MMMKYIHFEIYPAIDLRQGKVVRLMEGDPDRQTKYADDPAAIAEKWIAAGTRQIHVVNLDAAFGEDDTHNQVAIGAMLKLAGESIKIQLGGGIRTIDAVKKYFDIGIYRVIFGTAVVENPALLQMALDHWTSERIAVSLDAKEGIVQVKGWKSNTGLMAIDLAKRYQQMGLKWMVYTDIARDGLQKGINLDATKKIAEESQLSVIASGGVMGWEDIHGCYQAGLAGIIVGRALYEGKFDPVELFHFPYEKLDGE